MTSLIQNYKTTANALKGDNLELLDAIYSNDVHFRDPFHDIHGLPDLKAYFARLYSGVERCEFEFNDELFDSKSAMLTWVMRMRHRTFRVGETLELEGSSLLKFDEKIHIHQDYFDAGAMIYERVPILGMAIRVIKKRL